MRAGSANDPRMLTLTVEAGLHFLRMLESTRCRRATAPAFIAKYALQPLPAAPAAAADDATRRFVQTMAGRAPDARLLAAAFRGAGAAKAAGSAARVAAGDQRRGPADGAAPGWRGTISCSRNRRAVRRAWAPSRIEYAVSVSARFSDQPHRQLTLSASEFDGGRLDWSSFDVNLESALDSTGDNTFTALTETTVPAPVTLPRRARGAVLGARRREYRLRPDAGRSHRSRASDDDRVRQQLRQRLVFVPLDPAGRARSRGEFPGRDRHLRRAQPAAADRRRRSAGGLFVHVAVVGAAPAPASAIGAPPVPNRSSCRRRSAAVLEGSPLEDVLFMRDEMANVAWAIERTIENPIEQALPAIVGSSASTTTDAPAPAAGGAPARYLLSSTVPENWIPLLPVQLPADAGKVISRLKRGAVLQPDGSQLVHHAQGQALNAAGTLLLYDEEVPREGVHVSRTRDGRAGSTARPGCGLRSAGKSVVAKDRAA